MTKAQLLETAKLLPPDERIDLVMDLWDTIRPSDADRMMTPALREELRRSVAEVKQRGGKVTREAGPMKHGTTVIAFVEDPDGYKIEVIQRGGRFG